MKSRILLLALSIALFANIDAQVVVQQQTVTTSFQNQVPGFQMNFNAWDPMISTQTQYSNVWDPIRGEYVLIPTNNSGTISSTYYDQFGNLVQQQQQTVYLDPFGNPIQQQPIIYVDQFGNPIQQQQQIIYVDQFGNPIQQQQQQQVIYVDQFGNPIQQQQPIYVDHFGNPIQVQTNFNCNPPASVNNNVFPQSTTINPFNNVMPMNPASFSQALSQINQQSFESTRLTVSKQIITSNFFTSDQVRQMMQQMSFESSRIELARFAYNRVLDQQNYYLVNNAFTFSSSVDELNSYLFGR